MSNIIVMIICGIICLSGVIWGWWYENGPVKKDDTEKESQKEGENELK